MRGTWGTETSKYPEEEKSTEISRVVASESERGQTESSNTLGVRTGRSISEDSWSMLESIHQRKWKSCRRNLKKVSGIQSTNRHEESVGNTGGPPSKPKYYLMTDSGEVLWRKGEKNPGRGVKENLKPYVYKHTKHVKVRCGTFCRMVRRVIVCSKVKHWRCGAAEKSSVKSALSCM